MSQDRFAYEVMRELEEREYLQVLESKYPGIRATWPNGNGCEPSIAPTQEPEMKISEMVPSSYLKQSDFDENGTIVTVSRLENKNVARDDEAPEHKWIVYFSEFEKGMVLNTTNINLMSKACGSDDTDDWTGKEVVVYVDPNVGYGGKTTGGLRVKKYNVPAAPKAVQKTRPAAPLMQEVYDPE